MRSRRRIKLIRIVYEGGGGVVGLCRLAEVFYINGFVPFVLVKIVVRSRCKAGCGRSTRGIRCEAVVLPNHFVVGFLLGGFWVIDKHVF